MTKVCISARGCTVEVEASGAKAADLIKLALDAHEQARDTHPERNYGATGFTAERAPYTGWR